MPKKIVKLGAASLVLRTFASRAQQDEIRMNSPNESEFRLPSGRRAKMQYSIVPESLAPRAESAMVRDADSDLSMPDTASEADQHPELRKELRNKARQTYQTGRLEFLVEQDDAPLALKGIPILAWTINFTPGRDWYLMEPGDAEAKDVLTNILALCEEVRGREPVGPAF